MVWTQNNVKSNRFITKLFLFKILQEYSFNVQLIVHVGTRFRFFYCIKESARVCISIVDDKIDQRSFTILNKKKNDLVI